MRLIHLALLFGLLLCPLAGKAVVCTVSGVQNISFGNVNPLATSDTNTSMTFNYSCTKELADVLAGVTICFNIGASAVSGQVIPRRMSFAGPPAGTLDYQLYQNPAYTTVWGSQYQSGTTVPAIQLNLLNLTPVTGSVTVYAKVPARQTSAIPGNHQDTYTAATASMTMNVGLLAPPTNCGTMQGPTFPFTVTAAVTKFCNVTTASNINLGSVPATQTNINASNSIGVACTSNTPYTIGLAPSNNSSTGSGVMKSSTGNASNSDRVPYQLRTAAGTSGAPWGNTTGTNTVAGTGNGQAATYTVWATVPSANYTPDTYADTVTINVTY
ncbi:Csu type fimbrial protein [Pseudocitrobacter cyperus]|uniref:Spore coat protein U domain-containing protein n=1 Tax=Pseudocitrobacter cyperus TaxID=3112843 RepID=A0ABV0HIU6_9ENTR